MTTRTKQRYRPPSIEPEVEPVSLDDFDIDDIRDYILDLVSRSIGRRL